MMMRTCSAGGLLLLAMSTSGCSDGVREAQPSMVEWTEKVERPAPLPGSETSWSVVGQPLLAVTEHQDVFAFRAEFELDPDQGDTRLGALEITAISSHPFAAGTYRCQTEAEAQQGLATAYTARLRYNAIDVRDCTVTFRASSVASPPFARTYIGTFTADVAPKDYDVSNEIAGAFNLPTVER